MRVLATGSLQGGLYHLHFTPSHLFSTTSSTSGFIWHQRLGHAPSTVLQHITEIAPTLGHSCKNKCYVCPLAKQHRLSFPVSCTSTSVPFELIQVDLWPCGALIEFLP